jgi:hypothetical protein
MNLSQVHSVVIQESKWNGRKNTEEYGRYKMFCICGYTGEAKNKNTCPKCKKKGDVSLDGINGYTKSKASSVQFGSGKSYITFKSSVIHYSRENKHFDKVRFKTKNATFKIQYDRETKSFSGSYFGRSGNYQFGHLFHYGNEEKIHIHNTLHAFYKEYEEMRNFFHAVAKESDMDEKMIDILIKEYRLYDFFAYVYYPVLLKTPWRDFKIDSVTSRLFRNITEEDTYPTICQKLFGHSSKKVRKALLNPQMQNLFLLCGPIIKDLNLLLKIGEYEVFYNRDFSLDNSYGPADYLIKGIKVLSSVYDEKVWINQLMKKFLPPIEKYTSQGNLLASFYGYIEDIGRLIYHIESIKSTYKPVKSRYVEDFHDNLSKDLHNLRYPNETISYKAHEEALEKKWDDAEIILAKNTHELVDTGKVMNICVGSYAHDAVNKRCSILLIKENNNPSVCLELRGKTLWQAKMHFNQKPNEKYKKMIIEWAEENKINYEECYDMK